MSESATPLPTFLSDDLLRQLMGVGQVDVLVGLPTENHAATAASAVRAVRQAFGVRFGRVRSVLMHVDRGSDDGTTNAVSAADASGENGASATGKGLRTVHQISTWASWVRSRAEAHRVLFAAADLLQARAVAVLDADTVEPTPERVAALLEAVRDRNADFVAPVYRRDPLDGPLLSQLLRPLVRSTYGRKLSEPVCTEFACSGRFAAHCLADEQWGRGDDEDGSGLWLPATALGGEFSVAQVKLGVRKLQNRSDRPSLQRTFRGIGRALFECLQRDEETWIPRRGTEEVATFGEHPPGDASRPAFDAQELWENFRNGVRGLEPLHRQILDGPTERELLRLAEASSGAPDLPDALWVSSVIQFLTAAHRGVMSIEHLVQALVPLYLGRTAAFVESSDGRSPEEIGESLEALASEFERSKEFLIRMWKANE